MIVSISEWQKIANILKHLLALEHFSHSKIYIIGSHWLVIGRMHHRHLYLGQLLVAVTSNPIQSIPSNMSNNNNNNNNNNRIHNSLTDSIQNGNHEIHLKYKRLLLFFWVNHWLRLYNVQCTYRHVSLLWTLRSKSQSIASFI